MQDDGPSVRGQGIARPQIGTRHEDLGVDEVGDDLDRPAHLEDVHRLAAQPLAHRGHRIASLDHEAGERKEARFPSYQSDVGAVKCGHGRDVLWSEHLLGQIAAGRVWNGVVDVEDVERVLQRHLGHLARQRQGVGCVGKGRIAAGVDFVEVQVRRELGQTMRMRVAEEVHLVVVAACERDPQLGGQDPAPALRGEGSDTDAAATVLHLNRPLP